MRSQRRLSWFPMMALVLASTGCCCVQGMPGNPGSCGMGDVGACRSCSGGCGETYVDEWISHPPQVDVCCANDCRPVRSLLQTLWGSRFVGGCDACAMGCDDACGGSCGYASAGGSGCTSCGGSFEGPVSSGGCNCGGGGPVTTEPIMEPSVHHMPQHSSQFTQSHGEPRMVPGSYKVSAPRRLEANVASQRINPAMQKMEARRASYAH